MANKHLTLGQLFKDIADAIRTKTGKTEEIIADAFADAILEIQGGADPEDMVVEANGSIGSQWVWDETEQGWCKDVSATAKATLDGVTKTATSSTKLNGQDLYEHGVEVTKQGTATASDVLEYRTFTNSYGVNIVGTMKRLSANDVVPYHYGGSDTYSITMPSSGYYPSMHKEYKLVSSSRSIELTSNTNNTFVTYGAGNNASINIKVAVPKPVLLWTNPNPNSGFAAQTISVPNCASYSTLLFEVIGTLTNPVHLYASVLVAAGTARYILIGGYGTSTSNYVYRKLTVYADNTIALGTGAYPGTSTANACIPVRIFGIPSNF